MLASSFVLLILLVIVCYTVVIDRLAPEIAWTSPNAQQGRAAMDI